MIDQHTGVGFLYQHVFHTGIRPEKLPVTGLVRLLAVVTEPFRHDLRGRFASESVESAGDFFLPASLQVQSVDKLYRLRCVLMHHNLIRISIFPVSEGRRDHDAVFLLLAVSRPDLFANILRIIIIHQAADADDQVIFVAECINALRGRDHAHLAFPQVIDEQCGLGPMAAKPG